MERFAEDAVLLVPGSNLPDRWIGLYPAKDIEVYPWGVRYVVPPVVFRGRGGFAYSSQGLPPKLGMADEYRRLDDHWYLWTDVRP